MSLAALDEYSLLSEFCGVGGDSYGATRIAGVKLILGANHDKTAIESHAANFPDAEHYCGDVRSIDMAKFPRADIAWFSPSCPPFSSARGVRRDFDRDTQGTLWETEEDAEVAKDARRGRTLMFEVIRYLEGMMLKHSEPVLAFVVENVPEARKWDAWPQWTARLRILGYELRVIALNSMHARAPHSPRAPQSRDRLYVAGIHRSIGRTPDWDKWLRPRAHCPVCDETVTAMQVFKKPGADMGRYGKGGQYWYRCPHSACRNQIVEPEFMTAYDIIDWTNLGTPIGERKRPMAPATLTRIEAGILKHMMPITVEAAGNTFERRPGVRTWPVDRPITTQTTTATKGLAIPPMIVPVGGTWRRDATTAYEAFPTRTTRESDGLAIPPFVMVMRSGRPRSFDPVTDPTATITAGSVHHALVDARADEAVQAMLMRNCSSRGDGSEMCTGMDEAARTITTKGHQSLVTWQSQVIVPYYSNGVSRPLSDPVGTVTTKDRWSLATDLDVRDIIDIEKVRFRMLTVGEIAAAMAFPPDYIVLGTQGQKIRQLGNAVTPPSAEVIVSALVECLRGSDLMLAA